MCRSCLLFVFCVSCMSLAVFYHMQERADLLAHFYLIFPCVFATLPYGVLGQVIVDCIDL